MSLIELQDKILASSSHGQLAQVRELAQVRDEVRDVEREVAAEILKPLASGPSQVWGQ
jgi:hypothetical protein